MKTTLYMYKDGSFVYVTPSATDSGWNNNFLQPPSSTSRHHTCSSCGRSVEISSCPRCCSGCWAYTCCHRHVWRRDTRGSDACWGFRCWHAGQTRGPSRSRTPASCRWRSRLLRGCAYYADLRGPRCSTLPPSFLRDTTPLPRESINRFPAQ